MSLKKLSVIFEKVTGVKLTIKWGVKDYRPREVMMPWKKGVKFPDGSRSFLLKKV
jgi:hypothetical protein